MTKYATLRKYQPYIDVIMDDLGLTGKVEIDFVFGSWRSKGGDARMYNCGLPQIENGLPRGLVRVDKCCSRLLTLEILMHELKHIQQYISGRLSINVVWEHVITKRGALKSVPYRMWDGVKTQHHKLSMSKGYPNSEYLNLPWEQDARTYEKEVTRLFPNYKLPQKRKLIGVVGKVKFYKTAS